MPPPGHQERRLLDRVVPDRHDEIGAIDRLVDVVAFTQSGGAEIEIRSTPDDPLPHLRIEERDADAAHEFGKRRRKLRPACAGAEHQQRIFGGQDQIGGAPDGFRRWNREFRGMDRNQRDIACLLRGNVFRQFEMNRAGTFLGRDAKGIADQGRNTRCAHDLL